jgi:hypothetical protein
MARGPLAVGSPYGVGAAAALPSHLFPPAGAQSKNLANYIDVPAPGDPAAVIFSYTVPLGMRLVLNQIGNNFVGGGFSEGSRDLVWQVWDNGSPIEDFEAITGSLGNVAQPTWLSPIIFEEGHTVSFVVLNPAGGPIVSGSGQVGATLRGYYFNRLEAGIQEWST